MNSPETLESLLLVENSRRNADLVAGLIFQKQELFDELFRIYIRNEEPVSRRAAWVADIVTEKQPALLEPLLDEIVVNLPRFTHDGMKRESLRMLARSPLPAGQLGKLISICFDWLTSGKETVAVKMYSMEILYRISLQEPGLKRELADSIEWRMQEETPGFRAHGRKLLRQLNRG
jgi:hypothetical protein